MKRSKAHKKKLSSTCEQRKDRILRGYTCLQKLGRGSQGDVFLARRDRDKLKVAIKRLNIESVKTWKTYDLFHREATIVHIEYKTVDTALVEQHRYASMYCSSISNVQYPIPF